MDGDLFQGVLLGLQALGLIVLVALLATLSGIRKTLEQRASQAGSDGVWAATQAGHRPAVEEGAAAAAQPAAATAVGGQASAIRGVLEQHGVQEAEAAPAQAQPASVVQEVIHQEGVVDSVFATHADDPQEEPFQRDGRWWFRRGDELLLYDEATGQWQPAPQEAGGAAAGLAGEGPSAQSQRDAAGTAEGSPAVADAVATYWKCPTCGAVNGSTAATCRMCFAARP